MTFIGIASIRPGFRRRVVVLWALITVIVLAVPAAITTRGPVAQAPQLVLP